MPSTIDVPLAVIVTVEYADGTTVRRPVAVFATSTVHTLICQLNKRLGNSLEPPVNVPAADDPHVHERIDVRLPTGEPVRDWSRTVSQVGITAARNTLMVISSSVSPKKTPKPQAAALVKAAEDATDPSKHPNARVIPPSADAAASAVSDPEADDVENGERSVKAPEAGVPVRVKDALEAGDALHLLQMDGAVRKVFSQVNCPTGGVVCFERPKLSLAYPMQLVECIRHDPILRTRTYDPEAAEVPSTISGVGDDDYTKYLSIALTHGKTVHTSTRYDRQLAFHSKLLAIPHACRPSCSKSVNVNTPPFTAVLRCAVGTGLVQGDEITVLYDSVNRPEFLMLPVDRRQKILQRRYFFTCKCDRCMKSGGGGPVAEGDQPFCTPQQLSTMSTAAKEATLSGAFWGAGADTAAKRRDLAAAMRAEFAALGIASSDDDCSLLVTNQVLVQVPPDAMLAFIRKYHLSEGPLTLHRHHWRLSLVRMAYLRRISGGAASAKAKYVVAKNHLERDTFTIAVHQLAAEAVFIDDGHPLSLATYRAYKRLLELLPDNLAAETQRSVRENVTRDWSVVHTLDALVP